MKLKVKLFLIAAGAGFLGIFFLIPFIFYSLLTPLEQDLNKVHDQEASHTLMMITNAFAERQKNVANMATYPHLRNYLSGSGPATAVNTYLDEVINLYTDWESFGVIDMAGKERLSTNIYERDYVLQEEEYMDLYEEAKKGKIVHSDVFVSGEVGVPVVVFMAPVVSATDSGKVIGVIEGNLRWSSIENVFGSIIPSKAYLLNLQGLLLGTNDKQFSSQTFKKNYFSSPTFQHALSDKKAKSSVTEYQSLNSNTKVLFSHATENNWILIIETPRDEAYTGAITTALRIAAVQIVSVFVLLFLVWKFISKFVAPPLEELTTVANEISQGDLSKRVNVKSKDEIGTLATAFNNMAQSLEESNNLLQNRIDEKTMELSKSLEVIEEKNKDLEATQTAIVNVLEDVEKEKNISQNRAEELKKFQLAVENASDHIIITDKEGIVLYANNAVTKITGYSRDDVLGQKAGALWGKQMDLAYYQNFWKTIKTDKKVYIGEITNKRLNGEKYIAEISISPILDEKGEVIYFVGIERDITKAKEIDRMKTEFISLASHQLRTPLSAMRWASEMLLNGDAGQLTEQQKKLASDLNKSNNRMIELVNFLLNISRIESGRLIIAPKQTNLKSLIENVIKETDEMIKLKQQKLTVDIDPHLPEMLIDPKIVEQIYLNLVTNAVKYTPEKGSISIKISLKDDDVISQVSDSGYGIPENEKERVFQKFYRGSNIIRIDTQGTGLGLYLVKQLVEASGGKIWFESTQDRGTTFWFSLPLSGSHPKEGDVSLGS